MITDPRKALDQLRRDARDGTLADLCQRLGIELLVVFGSTSNPASPRPPSDLDLAVLMNGQTDLLNVLNGLVMHLGYEQIDLMDLGRADVVARAQALGRGKLLYEATPGTFAEQQVFAIVQHADTQWFRTLRLESLAR